jgi:uncharacterized protein (TIGR00266 family)
MPFCTQCGYQVTPDSKFCPQHGVALAAAPCGYVANVANPAGSLEPIDRVAPLDYSIQGDNLQVARVRLQAGQTLYAEAGKMVYKTPSVEWETRMSGNSLGDKIWGAIKRTLAGESLFLTYFRTMSSGEVGFAGNYPGRVMMFDLKGGQSLLCQRDGFLFAQSTVTFNIALVKKLGSGFFGGEGFILEKFSGPGMVFVHGGGDFIEFDLKPGDVLQVETGQVVAFDETVDYDIQFVGSIKTAIFGGEGLFLATLRGPGKAIIQSMTLEKMRRELAPNRTGGDSRSPLETFSGVFSSED